MNLETARDRQASLAVGCPHCPAEPGQVCVRFEQLTGKWVELERIAAHPSRMSAAGVVHAPLDPREYRDA